MKLSQAVKSSRLVPEGWKCFLGQDGANRSVYSRCDSHL
ncbi:INTS9 isoform 4 [Pan troglodytes]|uniref:INTS9 isoform 4 n=1 Tax=Pan troglodytes TaxID=9598 RepID=A0A2J8N8D2_PANTR|nr:INTS9 isoform 4 [Pan troglodytes]